MNQNTPLQSLIFDRLFFMRDISLVIILDIIYIFKVIFSSHRIKGDEKYVVYPMKKKMINVLIFCKRKKTFHLSHMDVQSVTIDLFFYSSLSSTYV